MSRCLPVIFFWFGTMARHERVFPVASFRVNEHHGFGIRDAEKGQGDDVNRLLMRLCAAALFFGFGAAVSHAATPTLPVCSWPFEVTGQGITNVATPDTNATYWVMPLDLGRWRAMVIHGRYPDARFFNFTTYTASGALVDTIFDGQIAPDAGSANPFAERGPAIAGSYTVTIGANPGSGNFL